MQHCSYHLGGSRHTIAQFFHFYLRPIWRQDLYIRVLERGIYGASTRRNARQGEQLLRLIDRSLLLPSPLGRAPSYRQQGTSPIRVQDVYPGRRVWMGTKLSLQESLLCRRRCRVPRRLVRPVH